MRSEHPLLDEIQQGESKSLEFKSQLTSYDQLAKTMVAFANSGGGKLVIGVDDKRKLKGLGDSDVFELMDQISSTLYDSIAPALLPETYVKNVQGTELLVIGVSRGSLLPYYLKKKGKEKGCYVRVGATNRIASAEQLAELERQRFHRSFDEQTNFEVSLEDLDLSPLEQRFQALGKTLNQQQLQNLKLVCSEQGSLYPTHGLLILLGYYEHCEIKCSRFKGNTMSVFLDKKEYRGDLFSQLEQAELFIKNHLHLKADIDQLQRKDSYEIPFTAIREVLVNALVHRDYSNFGRDIKLGIYDDALNIVSPGGLPNGLTADDIQRGRSEVRNRAIARVFKTLNYIEQWGSGIQRIQDACQEEQLPAPKLSETGDFIDWELYRPLKNQVREHASAPEVSVKMSEKMSEKVSEKMSEKMSEKILRMLAENPGMTIAEMAQTTGTSTRTIERNIKKLQDAGKLKRIGADKGGYWQVQT